MKEVYLQMIKMHILVLKCIVIKRHIGNSVIVVQFIRFGIKLLDAAHIE